MGIKKEGEIMKYTSSPWFVIEKSIGGAYQIVDGKEGSLRIATVTNGPREKANADLIAAAPEMLNALKDLVSMLHDQFENSCNNNNLCEYCLLVAKAEGR